VRTVSLSVIVLGGDGSAMLVAMVIVTVGVLV